jgi:hypothetical protein
MSVGHSFSSIFFSYLHPHHCELSGQAWQREWELPGHSGDSRSRRGRSHADRSTALASFRRPPWASGPPRAGGGGGGQYGQNRSESRPRPMAVNPIELGRNRQIPGPAAVNLDGAARDGASMRAAWPRHGLGRCSAARARSESSSGGVVWARVARCRMGVIGIMLGRHGAVQMRSKSSSGGGHGLMRWRLCGGGRRKRRQGGGAREETSARGSWPSPAWFQELYEVPLDFANLQSGGASIQSLL